MAARNAPWKPALGLVVLGAGASLTAGVLGGRGGTAASTPEVLAAHDAQALANPAPLIADERAADTGVAGSMRHSLAVRPAPDAEPGPPSWTDVERLRAEGAREKDFLALYRSLARLDPRGFERRAVALLRGSATRSEKIAFLRALWDASALDASKPFLAVLLADTPTEDDVSAFAVRFLGQHAAGDLRARGLLEGALWPREGTLVPALRRRAAAHLASAVDERDMPRLAQHLRREQDPDVIEAALVALAANPKVEPPPQLSRELGFDPPALLQSARSEE